MTTFPRFATMDLLDAAAVVAALSPEEAADVLEEALRDGFDPEDDGRRSRLRTPTGELMFMPAADGQRAGIKVLSSTPDNGTRDLPLIQGAYLLFEGPGQRPAAVIDGIALTNLRTPAVTLLALRHLASPAARRRAVIIGDGTQAGVHAVALATSGELDIAEIALVGLDQTALDSIATTMGETPGGDGVAVTTLLSNEGAAAIGEADIIVTCTPSREPVFDGALVQDSAVVVAMGSHSPDARETDDALVARAHIIVESRAATLEEAGDVIIPIESGLLDPVRIMTLRDIVTGAAPVSDRPRLFKFTGMPWEDLTVAAALHDA